MSVTSKSLDREVTFRSPGQGVSDAWWEESAGAGGRREENRDSRPAHRGHHYITSRNGVTMQVRMKITKLASTTEPEGVRVSLLLQMESFL